MAPSCCTPALGSRRCRRVTLPRSAAGRRPVPLRQGEPAHPRDLFRRRRYLWPCILLLAAFMLQKELDDLCHSHGLVIK
jgi:hypothetical protein